jgi:hypothetical protein
MKHFCILIIMALSVACGPVRQHGDTDMGQNDMSSQTCTGMECGSATVSWDRNPESDIIAYKVFVSSASGVYADPVVAGPQQNSIKIDHLFKGQSYYFIVIAVNPAGESPPSDEVQFTTPR